MSRRHRPLLALLAAAALASPLGAGEAAAPPAWTKTCSLCHGPRGRPSAGLAKKGVRDLSDPDWQRRTSDEAIAETIRKGRPGTLMAAYEGRLSAEQIAALVRFIRTLVTSAEESEPEPAPESRQLPAPARTAHPPPAAARAAAASASAARPWARSASARPA